MEYVPEVVLISRQRALLELKNTNDQLRALSSKELTLEGKKVRLLRWSLGFDTLSSSWFQPSTRWLMLFGIPYHLATFEVVESLCASFGKLVGVAKVAASRGGRSGMRIKVKG